MHVAYLMRRWIAFAVALLVFCTAFEALAQQITRPKRGGRAYKVRVDSAPQQAAVYLDDEKYGIVGYTPWDGRLQKGDWKVIVKKDGFKPVTVTMTVKRTSRVQEKFVPLAPDEATLDIRADADRNTVGAEIWIDGEKKGTIPAEVKVKDGRH